MHKIQQKKGWIRRRLEEIEPAMSIRRIASYFFVCEPKFSTANFNPAKIIEFS